MVEMWQFKSELKPVAVDFHQLLGLSAASGIRVELGCCFSCLSLLCVCQFVLSLITAEQHGCVWANDTGQLNKPVFTCLYKRISFINLVFFSIFFW